MDLTFQNRISFRILSRHKMDLTVARDEKVIRKSMAMVEIPYVSLLMDMEMIWKLLIVAMSPQKLGYRQKILTLTEK